MSEELSIKERLKKLPHQYVVAFAARCARRVQPLAEAFFSEDGPKDWEIHVSAIDRALKISEAYAAGAAAAAAASIRAATNAANAARAADAARAIEAAAAAAAADDAARAVDPAAYAARAAYAAAAAAAAAADADADAEHDLSFLEELARSRKLKPTDWAPIDATESGPLGDYWTEPPKWWYPPKRQSSEDLLPQQASDTASGSEHDSSIEAVGDNTGLIVEIDLPDDFTSAQVQELVAAVGDGLDEVYQGFGGRGLTIKDVEIEECVDAPVPVDGE